MRLPRRTALSALALVPALALAACGAGSSSQATDSSSSGAGSAAPQAASGELTVFAAASLQGAFQEIGAAVEKENPDLSITFDFQGSQDLVASLSGGAPADVLATANESTMKDATDQSLVGQSTEFATNVLTLIVPEGNPAGVTGLDSSLTDAKLVICAPEVPCGEATAKLAQALGVTLDPVSEEQKVTDVRGKVESGEADAGIVYTTDAAAAKGVETISIPDGGVINHYPIAPTAKPANAEGARVFIDYVLSQEGQAVLTEHGFGAPGASAGASGSASSTPAGTASTTKAG
ncbi:molybdate ABC transporter substrate-binding protein [Actinomyces slackii]|uniref:Molybdate-binding periplasmic protein n=1 Tax=Actinomyces slackii TaxID=52774 RepID=A0A448KFW1_9ACTO|nr:molybdate ABC transporter substrate-binding protein [Actinomyces slackii]VEG75809.1 Molybdate-binding periplasmic protein precursor [Actinomyces slackii]